MVKGWMPKSCLKEAFNEDGELHIYDSAGIAVEWAINDWPPIPVTVLTAEEVDTLNDILEFAKKHLPDDWHRTAMDILEGK